MFLLNHILNKEKISPLLIAFLMVSFNLKAQEAADTAEHKFNIGGQFRPRVEFRYGTFRPMNKGEKPAAFISDRLRLSFEYSYKNLLTLKVAPQVVSIWGQANMVQGAENSGNKFSVFEAWAILNATPNWSFKIGRQVISLDDERFFGELDWAQGARAHDAISVQFSKKKYELKGFFAYNQNYKALYANNMNNPSGNLYSTSDAFPHKWMQTIWASFPIKDKSKVTLLVNNLGFQQANSAKSDTLDHTTRYTQTFGANFFHNAKGLSANLAAYYQRGQNLTSKNIQAYMFAAYIGYDIKKQWHIGVGSDFVSGNKIGIPIAVNNSFTPYFHTGHKFYGNMDYFYAGNGHKNAGLSDTYLKLNFKSEKGYSFLMVFHQFVAPYKVMSGAKKYAKNLGQEMDLSFNYKINKFVAITGGYSFYLANSTIKYLKDTPTAGIYQQWAWMALNINPTFYKTKNKH